MYFKHGESYSRLHSIWADMKKRCLKPKSSAWEHYGGRGITICPEWANDYISFRDWSLNNGYTDNLEINRINNNGNYCPENCNFVTRRENVRNQRRVKLTMDKAKEIRILYTSGNYTRKELSIKYNVSIFTIDNVIYNKKWVNS